MISRRQFNQQGIAMVAGLAAGQGTAFVSGAAGQNQTTPATAPRTMRALRLTEFRRPLHVTDIPVAAPRADGALVRVEASGVCRSDWHFWNQDWTWMELNLPTPDRSRP